ncbi:MAG TPA: BlaI/MecI/CopY family transcriptional regulator [Planctomycetaceae bacterium]|nr:BlaI/MecI/CopY family transcriptional regulator [Opitutaceae bacterium]HVW01924.1 BlaI/MecI/CopY family transcriptional regulator [Planctomycetaceae bacterium]
MSPKISSAEWEVMTVIWDQAPVTATDVFAALPPGHGWKQKTVNTFLARLVEKGALTVDKTGKAHVYRAKLPRAKCVQQESDSFLQRVFRGATGDLVLHFCSHAKLSDEEIRELEHLLESKKGRK